MEEIEFVHKQIKDSHLVWIKHCNLYFKLEEPAWFVFSEITKRQNLETIAREVSSRYDYTYADSLNFVKEIRQRTYSMSRQPQSSTPEIIPEEEYSGLEFTPYSTRCYQLQNTIVTFSYETAWLENYIHPLLQHLETSGRPERKACFELFSHQNRVIFRLNGTVIGNWATNQSEYVKGRVLLELANVIYHKTDSDWLMTLHASAVTNGQKTILFSAAPGSGKTTFAALLQANGYRILSDDFVPLERDSFKAYSLPLAMSVKPGSLELLTAFYPTLDTNRLVKSNTNKIVKYLPIDAETTQLIFPVKEIVFIKYDNTVDFLLEEVEPIEALNTIIDEAWIPPNPENVEQFMHRVSKTLFYKLSYSNNTKAINAITQMFKND